MAESGNAPVSRTGCPSGQYGFESHPRRLKIILIFMTLKIFTEKNKKSKKHKISEGNEKGFTSLNFFLLILLA